MLAKTSLLTGLLKENGIQTFFDNPIYTEVAINRPYELWTESSQGWQKHDMPHLDYSRLYQIANAFFIANKSRITIDTPICSGIFDGGQRGQIVVPNATERNTIAITVRLSSSERFDICDYVNTERLNNWIDVSDFKTSNLVLPDKYKIAVEKEKKQIDWYNKELGMPSNVNLQLFELEMLHAKAMRDLVKFLDLAVKHKQNIVFVGATGSGKTTFTKAVCDLVPSNTRIITIEDTHELDLPYHPNHVHLFYKDVTPKQLLESCMRMKPDRIFLTELRGDEAYDYLNALNTGHGGSITTVHANDCLSAYYRIGSLIKQSDVGRGLDMAKIMADVFSTIDVVIFLDRTYVTQVSYDPVRKNRLLTGKAI